MASQHELLETHLEACLECLDRYFIRLGAAVNVAKTFNISEKEAVQALKATVLFHDYGKAAREYQQKITTGKLSFPKHEYFSAVAAYRTLAETSWKNESIIAILWHHMAMRGPNFAVDIKSWKKFNAPQTATFDQEYIENFNNMVKRHELSVVVMGPPPDKISYTDVEELTKKMYRVVVDLKAGLETYRKSLRLLRPLLIVDNLAAAMHRDGAVKIFVSDFPKPDAVVYDAELLRKILNSED